MPLARKQLVCQFYPLLVIHLFYKLLESLGQ